MDLMEDEPRKLPKPVPFCQNLLQPTVPEVSLILQDKFDDRSEKKNDSFSGTEFQTYNAWRWKHLNSNDKQGSSDTKQVKFTNKQECCLIRDKYSSSDVEKRKNEILYGQLDEPRRPLPPRVSPVIPNCMDSFFSSTSFDELKLDEGFQDRHHKIYSPVSSTVNNIVQKHTKRVCEKESDNSEKLYKIISEQNKQTEVLQKQIDQLLKLQEVKDKHIEQLLRSQESKENKIEQLLLSLETKDKEMEQLLKLKEKQEQQLQELISSYDTKQRENLDLMKKLNKIKNKNVCNIGVMTELLMVEASTNTSFGFNEREDGYQGNENATEEDISCIRDCLSDTNGRDKSLSLHLSDLPLIQEQMPTPQSSIHVDIQDFHDSSDDSDSDSKTLSNNFPTSTESQANPLGYTFYNNVLTQVKDIIQNSGEKEGNKATSKPLTERNYVAGQSFQAWGMLNRENFPPESEDPGRNGGRFQYESQNVGGKETCSPSDISLRINALAVKYLKQEQISQYNIQPQVVNPCQRDVTIYNVTNLSFGSMRYLDRYKILPKAKETQPRGEVNIQQKELFPAQYLRRKKKMSLQENLNPSCGNILDISTINRQPKLL